MQPSLPKVSVLIPCYQAHDFVAEAVRCALSQTYPNIEVIVSPDDGNHYDGLRAAFPTPALKILQPPATPRTGAGATRNRAIDAASGDFFVMLDADDLIPADYILRLASVAIIEGAAIAPTVYVQWDGQAVVRAPAPQASRLDLREFGKLLCSMHTMVHRSLEPGFPDGFAQDVLRDGLVIAKMGGVSIVKETSYRLRIRPGSACNAGEDAERAIQQAYALRQTQILTRPTALGMHVLAHAARHEFAELFAFRAYASRGFSESGENCYNTWAAGREESLWRAFRSDRRASEEGKSAA